MEKRMLYPDACKSFAIFLVTCSHCAQCLSGTTWTKFLGGSEIDIAFNMPLFMIVSGWFVNPLKLRNAKITDYVKKKVIRLVIPSIAWFLLLSVFTLHIPDYFDFKYSYWYLKALFCCLCIIMVACKIIKIDYLCALVTTIVVLAMPYSTLFLINFMFPFIWGGYFMRKALESNYAKGFSLICCLLGVALSFFWDEKYSIYMSPFFPIGLKWSDLFIYIYRFTIGFSISAVIIFLAKQYEHSKILVWMAKYGRYSLFVYVFSIFFMDVIFRRLLNHFCFHVNMYIITDVLAVASAVIIYAISVWIYELMYKNRYLRIAFLGE